jgi:RimJ/RimL family protein N-acetyltransferase
VPELEFPEPAPADELIRLRQLRADDLGAFKSGAADRDVRAFAHLPPPDEAAILAYIEQRTPADWSSGAVARFAVADAASDELLGGTMLFDIEWEDLRAEVGYWVVPAARGRGIAVHALRLTARWAFESLGLKRLQALTYPENEGGQRVALRAGFVRDGTLRSYFEDDRGRHDVVVLSLLPSD